MRWDSIDARRCCFSLSILISCVPSIWFDVADQFSFAWNEMLELKLWTATKFIRHIIQKPKTIQRCKYLLKIDYCRSEKIRWLSTIEIVRESIFLLYLFNLNFQSLCPFAFASYFTGRFYLWYVVYSSLFFVKLLLSLLSELSSARYK